MKNSIDLAFKPAPVHETIGMLHRYCSCFLDSVDPSANIWEELTRSGRVEKFEAQLRGQGATPWQVYLITCVAKTHPSSLALFEERIWREVENNALQAYNTLTAWRRLGRLCANNTSHQDGTQFFLRYPRLLHLMGADASLTGRLAELFAGRNLTWAEVESALKDALRNIENALSV